MEVKLGRWVVWYRCDCDRMICASNWQCIRAARRYISAGEMGRNQGDVRVAGKHRCSTVAVGIGGSCLERLSETLSYI